MTTFQVAGYCIVLLAVYLGWQRRQFSYSCPACGARREEDHNERCPWKKP